MSDKITRTVTVQLTTDYDEFDFDNFTDYIKAYAESETDYYCDVQITSTTDWSSAKSPQPRYNVWSVGELLLQTDDLIIANNTAQYKSATEAQGRTVSVYDNQDGGQIVTQFLDGKCVFSE